MDRHFADLHFASNPIQDNEDGFSGFELYRTSCGKRDRVASVLYWDAVGQFFIETFNADVPVEIIEELIAEARSSIKTR